MAEMTVAEAAAILRCSPDTVKRRAQMGKVQARRERGRWLITVPDGDIPTRTAPLEVARLQDDLAGLRAQLAHSEGMLAEVRAHNATLATQVDTLTRQLEAEQNAQAELRQLMALQLKQLPAHSPQVSEDGPQDTARSGWRWPWQR